MTNQPGILAVRTLALHRQSSRIQDECDAVEIVVGVHVEAALTGGGHSANSDRRRGSGRDLQLEEGPDAA